MSIVLTSNFSIIALQSVKYQLYPPNKFIVVLRVLYHLELIKYGFFFLIELQLEKYKDRQTL